MKLRRLRLLVFGGVLLTAIVASIGSGPPNKSYKFPFQFRPIQVSGTFGEMRSNHFHSGLDMKTGTDIRFPVYAIEDGYVYRLKVSPYGFGKAVYLRHPDGKFSVYAHLDGFNKTFEDFIYRKQYASKQYEQEIYLSSTDLLVKKGELIAFSGNSGASTGPHLHFEIREPDERIINPMQYYPGVINDHKVPVVSTVAFQPLDASSRVNGAFAKRIVTPGGDNGNYRVNETIKVTGNVGIEYHAWDLLDDAPNHCGINYARLFLDGKKIYEFAIERFSFDEKKYINLHFDYPHYRKTGRKYQRCYLKNGNEFSSYKDLVNDGVIHLEDDNIHNFKLELEDAVGNKSTVSGRMQRQALVTRPNFIRKTGRSDLSWSMEGKVLHMILTEPKADHEKGITVEFKDGTKEQVLPAYYSNGKLHFLYQVSRWRMPIKAIDPASTKSYLFDFKEMVLPLKNNVVEYEETQTYFPFNCVFDTVALPMRKEAGTSKMYSDIYHIGDPNTPILKSFMLKFKPNKKGPKEHMVVAKKSSSGKWVYLGSNLQTDGSIHASSGYFGSFCVMADSVAPVIKPVAFTDGGTFGSRATRIAVKVSDDFSGIESKKIMMMLDGLWVLGEYDAKTGRVTYRWRTRPSKGKHILEVLAYDKAGNQRQKEFTVYF